MGVVVVAVIVAGFLTLNGYTVFITSDYTCVDSDKGLDYYKEGTVVSKGYEYKDSCDNRGYVFEKYCQKVFFVDKFKVSTKEFRCQFGCKNGACVQG